MRHLCIHTLQVNFFSIQQAFNSPSMLALSLNLVFTCDYIWNSQRCFEPIVELGCSFFVKLHRDKKNEYVSYKYGQPQNKDDENKESRCIGATFVTIANSYV